MAMAGLIVKKCPNCGAPMRKRLAFGTTYTCPYCRVELELPQKPLPQSHTVQPELDTAYYDYASNRRLIVGLVVGMIVLSVGGTVVSMILQATRSSTPKSSSPEVVEPTAPSTPEPQVEVEVAPPEPVDSTGEPFVGRHIAALEARGCSKQLLPPTVVTGTQNVETRFLAKKGCVHILVATGQEGEPLTLSLKTPSKRRVETPNAAKEIEFVYCPKKSGKHPMKIEAHSWDTYTVAAVECPREP